MGSPLLLEVLASFTTVHEDSMYRRKPSQKALKHKRDAIRLVNNKLNGGMVEDEIILAVGLMAITSATLVSNSVSLFPVKTYDFW